MAECRAYHPLPLTLPTGGSVKYFILQASSPHSDENKSIEQYLQYISERSTSTPVNQPSLNASSSLRRRGPP